MVSIEKNGKKIDVFWFVGKTSWKAAMSIGTAAFILMVVGLWFQGWYNDNPAMVTKAQQGLLPAAMFGIVMVIMKAWELYDGSDNAEVKLMEETSSSSKSKKKPRRRGPTI